MYYYFVGLLRGMFTAIFLGELIILSHFVQPGSRAQIRPGQLLQLRQTRQRKCLHPKGRALVMHLGRS